ncbi:flavodoxin reductase [Candidatus Woesearchaeota archaeon]|nr:flavodoxin reductase [Candidatus Woesearchaeota archaeon]
MIKHKVRILEFDEILRNTLRIVVTKPAGYDYKPGQAVSIWMPGIEKPKPFTMTSLPSDDHLEFIIRIYPNGGGFTMKMQQLKVGDELEITNAWGKMSFKGNGIFIAGGCGITPFIAILRELDRKEGVSDENLLFYSCKSNLDIINEKELKEYLGDNAVITLTREKIDNYKHGRIDAKMIEEKVDDFKRVFYLCGPMDFIKEMKDFLYSKGALEVVTEL